jgi:hypothetical protein
MLGCRIISVGTKEKKRRERVTEVGDYSKNKTRKNKRQWILLPYLYFFCFDRT